MSYFCSTITLCSPGSREQVSDTITLATVVYTFALIDCGHRFPRFCHVSTKHCHLSGTIHYYITTKFSKRVQCSNFEFMFHSHTRFYVTQWSAARLCGSLSVYSRPLPSDKNRPLEAQLRSPFGDPSFIYTSKIYLHVHARKNYPTVEIRPTDRLNFCCLFTSCTNGRISKFFVVVVQKNTRKMYQKVFCLAGVDLVYMEQSNKTLWERILRRRSCGLIVNAEE